MRLVILGGGGFRVPLIHQALLARPELGIDELVLFDTETDRLDVVTAVLEPSPLLRVRTSSSLANALHDADFVFSAIRVGGAAGRVRDERRALDAGVLGQETVGAGGLTYALRTLPAALGIAHLIKQIAPKAWLINFTNPAGLVTEALREVLGDRVVGICDSPDGLVRRVCRALGIEPDEVSVDYAGINHLGWLRSVRQDRTELLPGLLADDARLGTFEEGRLFGPELLQSLGTLPNEYLFYYYAHRDLVAALQHQATRGEALLVEQDSFYTAAAAEPARAAELWRQALASREQSYLAESRTSERDAEDLVSGGYTAVALDLIAGLSGQRSARLILNVPNGKTIPQLPADLVVEVPCVVGKNSITPQPVAPLGLHELGLVAAVRASERAIITAVTDGSRAAAFRAFAIHPLIGSPTVARTLLDQLLADDPGLSDLLR